MKIFFLRRKQVKASEEAAAALTDAKKVLREVKQRGPEVSDISDSLRALRERNHFAERLEAIMRGTP